MKQLVIRYCLFCSVVMLILSCETDDRILETEQDTLTFKTVTKSEAQGIFGHFQQKREMKLAKSKAKGSLYLEITPDWNTFHQEDLDLDEATLSAVDITTNSKLDVESRLTFIEINASLLNVIESKQKISRVDGEMDSGYVYYHNLDGKFIVGYKMEQGTITSRLTKRRQSKSKTEKAFNYAKNPCEEEFDLFASDPCHGHLDEVIITTTVKRTHTMFIVEMSSEYFLDFGGWGGDTINTGGGSANSSSSDGDSDDRIVNELNDPCARNIFTQLEIGSLEQTLKQTMHPETNRFFTFHQSILEMFRGSDVTHLTIQNANTGNSNAYTVGASITIGNDYLNNATELSIARTMIHESVHAYINAMYSNIIEFNSMSFREKIEQYAEDNGYTIGTNEFHHEFMGQYVDAMAISLLKWDTDYGTGGNLGWDYYQAMAYGGLFQVDSAGNIVAMTDSFQELVPDANDRQEIADKLLNEQNGSSDAQGTECD